MKNIFYCFLVAIAFTACQNTDTPVGNKKTNDTVKKVQRINANGEITFNDSSKVTIPNFTDTSKTIFYIVRHAEKDSSGGENPALSPIGINRAGKLASIVMDVPLQEILTTSYLRCVKTVTQISVTHGLPMSFVGEHISDYLNILLTMPEKKGHRVFIVGHSNTIPEMLNYITQSNNYKTLAENEYDNLYIVVADNLGKAEVMALKY